MSVSKNQLEIIRKLKASGEHVGVIDNSTVVGDGTIWRARRTISGAIVRDHEKCTKCGTTTERRVFAEFVFEGNLDMNELGTEQWRFKEARVNRIRFTSVRQTMDALDRFTNYKGHIKMGQVQNILEGRIINPPLDPPEDDEPEQEEKK